MNFTAAAAVITAIAGLVLGGWKLAQDAAALRRLENLAKLREQLPLSSLARKSINEALDWTALKVLQKERLPLPQWVRFLGFALYLGGMLAALGSMFPMFEAVHNAEFGWSVRSFDPRVVVWPLVGACASMLVSMAGLLMSTADIRSRRRFSQLRRLRQLEEEEIVKAHKRLRIEEPEQRSKAK